MYENKRQNNSWDLTSIKSAIMTDPNYERAMLYKSIDSMNSNMSQIIRTICDLIDYSKDTKQEFLEPFHHKNWDEELPSELATFIERSHELFSKMRNLFFGEESN